MSKFFRSADSSSSSESESDSNREDKDEVDEVEHDRTSSTEGLAMITGHDVSHASTTRRNSNHRDILLHALLEERCVNETLASYDNLPARHRPRRDSPEVQAEAQTRYERICMQLASLNLISSGLENPQHARTRQRYRDGLDLLSQQQTTGVPPRLRRLLTDSDVRPGNHPQIQGTDGEVANPLLHGGQQDGSTFWRPALPHQLRRLLTGSEMIEHAADSRLMQPGIGPSIGGHAFPEPRYVREFEELSVLGRGGYGIVYRVKHRLDNQFYAIKKVPLSPSRLQRIQQRGRVELDEVLRELRTLARLDHPNIVRYFTGWIEWVNGTTSTGFIQTKTDDRSRQSAHEVVFGAEEESEVEFLRQVDTNEDLDHANIVFDESSFSREHANTLSPSSLEEYSSRRSLFEARVDDASNTALSRSNETVESVDRTMDASLSAASGSSAIIFKKPTLALHMQMSLHPMTLADYLSPTLEGSNRIGVAPPLSHCFHSGPTISILLAILDGLDYLHNEGIVHRDIKPGNIFIGRMHNPRSTLGSVDLMLCSECRAQHRATPIRLEIRIGDFGLVTFADAEARSSRSEVVGTELYRPLLSNTNSWKQDSSPNVHQTIPPTSGNLGYIGEDHGTDASRSKESEQDIRLDIYALGIVAFELLCPFSTRMERLETLQRLKQGRFPQGFLKHVGKHGHAMMECIRAMLLQTDETVSVAKIKEVLSALK